jgi:hypothetical protein
MYSMYLSMDDRNSLYGVSIVVSFLNGIRYSEGYIRVLTEMNVCDVGGETDEWKGRNGGETGENGRNSVTKHRS